MGIFTKTLLQFFIEICIFLILTIIGDLIYKKIKVKWAKSELIKTSILFNFNGIMFFKYFL